MRRVVPIRIGYVIGEHGKPRPWQFVRLCCYICAPSTRAPSINSSASEIAVRSVAVLPLIILSACAQAPANQPASGAASDTAEAARATEAAAATPPAAEPAQAADAQAKATEQATDRPSGAPPGYQVVIRNGQRYYCSDKATLGSRLKSRAACLTEEQYEMARQDAKDKMREKQGQTNTWAQ
jgi:glucan-binding YG repeat protein